MKVEITVTGKNSMGGVTTTTVSVTQAMEYALDSEGITDGERALNQARATARVLGLLVGMLADRGVIGGEEVVEALKEASKTTITNPYYDHTYSIVPG
jgi:hypothetical protein